MAERQRAGRPLVGGEEYRVVLVTAPDEAVGKSLARGLLESGLAACVNQLPGLRSLYRWRGAVQEDHEVLLVVKTLAASLESLATWLEAEHPYDVPECIALTPAEVTRAYAAWWSDSCEPADPASGES